MSAVKMSRPRIARATNDSPLSMEQIRHVAPAVFQMSPYSGMSEKYAYIPTINVLEVLLAEGFTVQEVAQARPYTRDKDPFAKHMLRMRIPQKHKAKVGDVVPEIVLINAHDGTARYYLFGGLFRFICCNGMVSGETIASMTVRHTGGDITRSRVLEGSYKIVEDEFPKMLAQREAMLARELTPNEMVMFAHRALALRYPGTVPPFKAEQLLRVRREVDDANDLWHVLNRVQENIMEGGFESKSFMYNRKTTIRPVERVSARVAINRGVWDLATAHL